MSNMDAARIAYLQNMLDTECISYGELQEIENAFAKLDPATLSDLPENATTGDMLDELYAYGVTMGSKAIAPVTTFYEDESRTQFADGSVTYAYPIGEMYPDAPSWAVYVGYTYKDSLRVSGPDFAEFRSDFMEWGPLA